MYGYARVVCKLESDLEYRKTEQYKDNIKRLYAIEASSDCLIKYSSKNLVKTKE